MYKCDDVFVEADLNNRIKLIFESCSMDYVWGLDNPLSLRVKIENLFTVLKYLNADGAPYTLNSDVILSLLPTKNENQKVRLLPFQLIHSETIFMVPSAVLPNVHCFYLQ